MILKLHSSHTQAVRARVPTVGVGQCSTPVTKCAAKKDPVERGFFLWRLGNYGPSQFRPSPKIRHKKKPLLKGFFFTAEVLTGVFFCGGPCTCDFEDQYHQRTLVVKYKDNLFKSAMTSYANKNIQNESIVFAACTEYLRGRAPPPT